MTKVTKRGAATALIAAFLLAALVFLFVKTASVDFKQDSNTLNLMREMRDLDAHWDGDAARLSNDFTSALARADFGAMMGRILTEAERTVRRGEPRKDLADVRVALGEKDNTFKALREAHARTVAKARAFDESLAALEQQSAGRAAARGLPRLTAVSAIAGQLRSDINRRLETFASRSASMQQRVAVLRQEALAVDPALGEAARAAESGGREFLDARQAEDAAWRKFSFLTLGSRIELAARAQSRAMESALDEKERWRVYLFFYAAALLIMVAYLGTRVVQTQGMLRRANEDLEKRVSERTRDLSQTLRRLKESEAQLVQSEKMSSLGQMVAGVAHEINSPLAYVKNSVATARSRMPYLRETLEWAERLLVLVRNPSANPAELRAAVEALEARLARLSREHVMEDLDALTRDGLHGIEQIVELVKNLKDFSRLDRSKVASFNVNEGVQATLLIAKHNLRKVDVEKHLGEVPSITCSPSQVNQVLLNLLNNAAQAMDKPRGLITVTTHPHGNDAVAISVEDNGKGIAQDALPKIFDPFYTTKEVGKGTGLGLSIAYKIVQQHGGRIDVSSTLGVGTMVTVTLPVSPPPEFAAAQAEEESVA